MIPLFTIRLQLPDVADSLSKSKLYLNLGPPKKENSYGGFFTKLYPYSSGTSIVTVRFDISETSLVLLSNSPVGIEARVLK